MSSKLKSPKSSTKNLVKNAVVDSPKKLQNSFSFIGEHICKNLLNSSDLSEIEDIIITHFKIESPDTDLKMAITLDFYVNLVLWFRENFQLDTAKFSLVFFAVHYLFENIRTNNLSLKENILDFRNMMVSNEGDEKHPVKGVLSNLTINEMKKTSEFILTGLVQHHKLLEYVFSSNRDHAIVETDLRVETLPIESTPYPPPLCESLDLNLYNECFATDGSIRSHSAKSTCFDDELEKNVNSLDDVIDQELSKFSDLSPETISRIIREECSKVSSSMNVEMETKIHDVELDLLKKISKIQKGI